MTVKLPIVVPPALQEQIGALVRYALFGLASSLVAKGWLPADADVNLIVGVVIGIGTLAWSQLTVRSANAEKQVMAARLPDTVAEASTPSPPVARSPWGVAVLALFLTGMVLSVAGCASVPLGDLRLKSVVVTSSTLCEAQARYLAGTATPQDLATISLFDAARLRLEQAFAKITRQNAAVLSDC